MRLLVHVEGQTEAMFTHELLRPHLLTHGFHLVEPRLIGNARLRQGRGGTRSWASVKRDIVAHLRQDAGSYGTTMVDYYALPRSGSTAWPGRGDAISGDPSTKAEHVERALHREVAAEMGSSFDATRFVPYVMMHEFEGLLFSDCSRLCSVLGKPHLQAAFDLVRLDFSTPEDINDSPETAPSKRIQKLIPEYEKPLYGNAAALEIGLDRIRAECPHFSRWLEQLESLS